MLPGALQRRPPHTGPPILVASYSDLRLCRQRQAIFVEHGSGQTYLGVDEAAYSGGPDRDNVVLFLCPNSTVAARNADRYPGARSIAVGCPRLDYWHTRPPQARSTPPVVAFTWHADLNLVPETRNGFRHFSPAVTATRDAGYTVLGHAHPRFFRRIEGWYAQHGIEAVATLDEVFARADILVADNTSAAFEFASLDRPIVWLTPPHYRRDVHHGLRFWDALVLGPEATRPEDVPDAIKQAITEYRPHDELLDGLYAGRDGAATKRAVEAILTL